MYRGPSGRVVMQGAIRQVVMQGVVYRGPSGRGRRAGGGVYTGDHQGGVVMQVFTYYSGGEMRVEYNPMNTDFTFDLFICVAILIMHSKELCKATDAASVYGCLNG